MKKLMLQLEKQKVLYEEKALVALQKATQDKTEAVSKAAALQVTPISTGRNVTHVPRSVTRSFSRACELVTCDAGLPNAFAYFCTFACWTHKLLMRVMRTQVWICPPQEALIAAEAEAVRWQNLHEELKKSSEQFMEDLRLSSAQLERLQSHAEVWERSVAMHEAQFLI